MFCLLVPGHPGCINKCSHSKDVKNHNVHLSYKYNNYNIDKDPTPSVRLLPASQAYLVAFKGLVGSNAGLRDLYEWEKVAELIKAVSHKQLCHINNIQHHIRDYLCVYSRLTV